LPDRLAFISMIISASILPYLEYFAQFTLAGLTSIYCLLIDSFKDELIAFNIPDNEVHLSWMLRARRFSLTYGTARFVNANYGYNIAPIAMDIIAPPYGNFSSALAPVYRYTSNNMDMGIFRDSPLDNFSSRHSTPLSVRSLDSSSDSSHSVATVLLGSSPRMDSSRVVIDLSLKTMKPTGRISDYDSSRKFLLDFHRYRQSGGSKKLSTLLQVPLDPKKPLISNFSSLFFLLTLKLNYLLK
jgi:hypothetical protein